MTASIAALLLSVVAASAPAGRAAGPAASRASARAAAPDALLGVRPPPSGPAAARPHGARSP